MTPYRGQLRYIPRTVRVSSTEGIPVEGLRMGEPYGTRVATVQVLQQWDGEWLDVPLAVLEEG